MWRAGLAMADTAADRPSGPGAYDARLVEREQQYRAVFEASSDGLVITDLDSELVIAANPAFCRMHGYERMDGLHPTTFIHPGSHHLFRDYLRAVREGREFRTRAQDVRRDGTVFDVEVIGRGFIYAGKPAILGVVRDVTDQARAYRDLEQRVVERTREIERRREVAEGLRELLAAVNSTRTLDEVLQYIVEQSCRLLGSDASAIFLPEESPEGEVLAAHAHTGLDPVFTHVRLPVELSSTGLAYGRRRPVIVPDLRAAAPPPAGPPQGLELEDLPGYLTVLRLPTALDDSRVRPPDPASAIGSFAAAFGSFLAVPLAVKDVCYGALSLYFRAARAFEPDEIALASAFADQAALALENARLRAQAEQAAVLEERQRLARELHDAVTQTLFSASLIAGIIPDLWETDPAQARERLDQLRNLTRGALAEMRMLLLELRPGALTELSLSDLLRQLVDAAVGATGVDATLTLDGGGPSRLPPDVQVALYRIAQEALNNTVKHAGASAVEVIVSGRPAGGVSITIRDDGCGFDPAGCPPGQLGMSIMRERASETGARLSIDSAPGAGTRVEVEWRRDGMPA